MRIERNFIICEVTLYKAVSRELYCVFIAFDRDDPHTSFFVEVGDPKSEESRERRRADFFNDPGCGPSLQDLSLNGTCKFNIKYNYLLIFLNLCFLFFK